jgi:hypothetical protein
VSIQKGETLLHRNSAHYYPPIGQPEICTHAGSRVSRIRLAATPRLCYGGRHGKETRPAQALPNPVDDNAYEAILADITDLLESARRAAARSVNTVMTVTDWKVGAADRRA